MSAFGVPTDLYRSAVKGEMKQCPWEGWEFEGDGGGVDGGVERSRGTFKKKKKKSCSLIGVYAVSQDRKA